MISELIRESFVFLKKASCSYFCVRQRLLQSAKYVRREKDIYSIFKFH